MKAIDLAENAKPILWFQAGMSMFASHFKLLRTKLLVSATNYISFETFLSLNSKKKEVNISTDVYSGK